jgi:hypothetical protein
VFPVDDWVIAAFKEKLKQGTISLEMTLREFGFHNDALDKGALK